MEGGLKYIISKEGLIKFIVITFGCITFALLADSGYYQYNSKREYVFAAFIVSFSFSVLFYFFRLIGLASRMQCGGPCSYDGFDFLWAWFSTAWCLSASITFAVNFPQKSNSSNYDKAIVSIVFAFLTSIIYGVEAYMLRLYAPANMGYVATKAGWMKTALVVFGAATFGLMIDSGYSNGRFYWCGIESSCDAANTYALTVFCVSWSVTTLIWIAHMAAPKGSIQGPKFQKVEMGWSALSVALFWSGASCLAAYMYCYNDDFDTKPDCQKRLTGVIAGFLTGALYLLDIFFVSRAPTDIV